MRGGATRILTLLTAIESHPLLTQRALASELEVALGTANHLLHCLESSKLIELFHTGGRTLYRLTPLGVSEKLRLLKLQIDGTVDHYIEIRDRISMSLESLDREHRRIVFYGAGDVAQLTYIVVATGDFKLVGVVDDEKGGQRFFGYEVAHPSELVDGDLNGTPFDTLVLVSYTCTDEMKENLWRMNFPPCRVFTLFD